MHVGMKGMDHNYKNGGPNKSALKIVEIYKMLSLLDR